MKRIVITLVLTALSLLSLASVAMAGISTVPGNPTPNAGIIVN